MKTLNHITVRGVAKRAAMLILAIGIFTSCGKTNTREDGSFINGNGNGNLNFSTNAIGGVSRDWQGLKSYYQCQNGGDGRIVDYTFTATTGSYTAFNDNLSGQFIQGYTGGQEAGTYLGVNPYGDLLYVERVTQGSAVAFNVTVSLCEYKVPLQNQFGFYFESIFTNGVQGALVQDLKLEVNDVLAGSVAIQTSLGNYSIPFAKVQ